MNKIDWKLFFIIVGIITGTSALVYLYFRYVTYFFGYPDGAGTYGDMFGALNVIFTGLVLLLTVNSFFQSQKRELELKMKDETEQKKTR